MQDLQKNTIPPSSEKNKIIQLLQALRKKQGVPEMILGFGRSGPWHATRER